MSYEDLMARIARDIPELAGKLSAPRVTYVKSLRKAYITFESTELTGERQFLKLENILKIRLLTGRCWTTFCGGIIRAHGDGLARLTGGWKETS